MISETSSPAEPPTLRELERIHIEWVLLLCDGNKRLAAKVLGIGRRTLYSKLAKYGIGEG